MSAVVLLVAPWLGMWILSADPTTDPTFSLSVFGAWAASMVALIAWQRDTAKQRDRALERLQVQSDTTAPILTEIRDVLRTVIGTQEASTKAMNSMAEAMPRIPSEPEVVRLRDALDRLGPNKPRPR